MELKKLAEDEEKRKRLLIALAAFAVAALTALTFYRAIFNDFTNWDDGAFIIENEIIREFSGENIKSWFTVGVTTTWDFFQPVKLFGYALIYRFWELNPAGYHLTSYVFHIINGVLVFWLLMKITRSNLFVSFAAATLFAIHPMRVESVAWASELKDVLYVFFYVLAFISFIKYRRSRSKRYYGLCLVLAALSLMSKPTAATFPLLMILWDFYEAKKFKKIFLFDKIPFIIFSIAAALAVLSVRNEALEISQVTEAAETIRPLYTRVLLAINSISFYLYKTIDPRRLSAFYQYPEVIKIGLWQYYVPLIIFAVIAAGCIYSLRYTKKVVFGFLFFVIAFSPHSHLVVHASFCYSDRATCLASIGFFWLAAWGLWQFWRMKKGRIFIRSFVSVFLILVFAGLCWLSTERIKIWKNAETLWMSVIEYDPDVAYAYYNLGAIANHEGRTDDAAGFFQKSVQVEPDYYAGYRALADVLQRQGDVSGAIAAYEECIRIIPDEDIHTELAKLYLETKDYGKALEHCSKALEINPRYSPALFNLGNVYLYVQKYDKAIETYEKTVAIDPKAYGAYENIGLIYLRRGDPDTALEYFRKSLEISGGDCFTHVSMSRAFLKKGLYDKGLEQLDKALDLEPSASVRESIEKDRRDLLNMIERRK